MTALEVQGGKQNMKGFIEVERDDGKKILVNTQYIEEVADNYIYFAFSVPNAYEQDSLKCKETYDELVLKIQSAV